MDKVIKLVFYLRIYIRRLGCWARKWGMRFQPVKCNIRQATRKRINKTEGSNTLEGTVLENVDSIKHKCT